MGGAGGSSPHRRVVELIGREHEERVLDDLLDAVRTGSSRALVLHGQPGVGKTALLEYLAGQAASCRVVAIAGVEAEMELSFAALHQLCAPMLSHLDTLPAPQREALEVTFGIESGAVPDRLVVGLGVLGLLSEVAAERPLLCIVDDAQWLDRASSQALTFAARRLGAESVGIVLGTRTLSREFAGLPELAVNGLVEEEARRLLASVLTVHVDDRVVDRFLSETQGNPLAVLELHRGLTAADLASGIPSTKGTGLSRSIEESFRQRVERLPVDTQRLLLLAAADPLGDPLLLWRAAEQMGIDPSVARPAVDDELVSLENRVLFRHPLVRSAVYRAAPADAKREAHAVLADVTDPAIDPERRAWHRAQAAVRPDEEVAAELEGYAGRAQARGGLAAAAAFLERATSLSPDPKRRATRALAAGQAQVHAGAYGAAHEMLALAETGPLDEVDRARLDLVRAQLAFATNRGSDAPPLLLHAARRLQSIDVDLARRTYLDALMAASMAGRAAPEGADVAAVARAASAVPSVPGRSSATDLLLDGLAARFSRGYTAALTTLGAALEADRSELTAEEELRWLSVASRVAMDVWHDGHALSLSDRSVRLAREVGSLSELGLAVNDRALLLLASGDLRGALSAAEEAYATADAVQSSVVPWGPMGLAAWRGHEQEASVLIAEERARSVAVGAGSSVAGASWAEAVLNNGLGRYQQALDAAQRAVEQSDNWVLGLPNWALMELIEAATHLGQRDLGIEAQRRITEMAEACGTDWALGAMARAQALTSEDREAEKLYRESVERLAMSRMRTELARSHLVFGEWLRRQGRRLDARAELHVAVDLLEATGLEGFAERARRELRATGETARKRVVGTQSQLTVQEAQVARLARDGLTNPEIASRLYISARTVQYHLSKVFTKLGISSRSQLDQVLE